MRRPPVPERNLRESLKRGLSRNWPLAALLGAFGLSRIAYALMGVRFDPSSLTWFWQYIDPGLLVSDFGRSILYLHSQPPAMNLFLGLVLRLFPGSETAAFWACYLALGVGLTVCLYLLLKNLGLAPLFAAGLTALFVVSPTCVLYENWLFYTYPVCVALVFAALCCLSFLKRPRLLSSVLLFSSLGLVALTWSLFHLGWLAGCGAALFVFRRREWRRIALGLALPLALLSGWYAKNAVLFGEFTASTWFGMNFSKMTNSMLRFEERRELQAAGTISAISLVPPFSDLEKYEPHLEPVPLTGIPVLDQRRKPNGIPNFNNVAYIRVSRAYAKDAGRIIAAKPAAYLRGLAEALLIFFTPADAYLFLAPNRARIEPVARVFSTAFTGQFSHRLDRELRRTNPAAYYSQALANTGFLLIAAYAAAFLYGVLLLRRRQQPAGRTMLFLWMILVYAFLVGNSTEVGENNRFRFVLDPLALVFVGVVLQRVAARLTRPSSRRPGAAPRSRLGA